MRLNCVPPTSYPTAEVFWVIKSNDGRWEPINFDKRISMDLEGKINICVHYIACPSPIDI